MKMSDMLGVYLLNRIRNYLFTQFVFLSDEIYLSSAVTLLNLLKSTFIHASIYVYLAKMRKMVEHRTRASYE